MGRRVCRGRGHDRSVVCELEPQQGIQWSGR